MKNDMYEEFIEDHFDEDVAHCITLMKNGTYTLEEMLEAVKELSATVKEYEGFPLTMGLQFDLIYRDDKLGYAVSKGDCNDYYIEVPNKYRRLPVICVSKQAFNGDDIHTIDLPGSIIYIDDEAFKSENLSRVTIGYNLSWNHWGIERTHCSLKKIGSRVFSSCKRFERLECYINYDAWLKICKERDWVHNMPAFMLSCQDQSVKIPAYDDVVCQENGISSKGLEYEIKNGYAWIISMGNCSDENLIIPTETYDGYKIIGIEEGAFHNNKKLITVVIPKTVEIIKGAAFSKCSNLKSVKLHYGLKEIRGFVFEGCCSLTSIEIPSSVINIGNNPELPRLTDEEILLREIFGERWDGGVSSGNPFKGCTKLRSIRVNSGNAYYHDYINCLIETKTKKVVSGCKASILPGDDSCETIGEYAFWGCNGAFEYGLYAFEEPKIKNIERYAFAECTDIRCISFPHTLTSIGKCAFEHCSRLEKIEFSSNLNKIENCAFKNCSKLYSICFPPSLEEIGGCAFENCRNLTKVDYSQNSKISEIKYSTYSNCSSLMSIVFPQSLKRIGAKAFEECRNLPSVILPNSLEAIEEKAFESCDLLRDIFIPESVVSIDSDAFMKCGGYLNEIECEASIKPKDWNPNWNKKDDYDSYHEVIWGAQKE